LTSNYTFEEYCPEWPAAFAAETGRLREMLGDVLTGIRNIGSTSARGLAAKAAIDLMPVTEDVACIDDCNEQLQEAGYHPWGEYGLPGRPLFGKVAEGVRTHNLHF